jgi:hypothetical protein
MKDTAIEHDRTLGIGLNEYMPILLTRLGERQALRDLIGSSEEVRLAPMFVVAPVAWDFEEEAPAKTLAVHLAKLPQELFNAWGARRAYIDLLLLADDGPIHGDHPLWWLTRECKSRGMRLIPVVSPARSTGYRAAAAHVVSEDNWGACLRLQIEEWPNGETASLDAILEELKLRPKEIDLVLDLADEAGPLEERTVRAEIGSLPYLLEWRSIVIAATAMPATMPPGRGLHVIPRTEWQTYVALISGAALARDPSFGDYAIANPELAADIDPRTMQLSAMLRYTAEEDWLIARGTLFKGHGGRGQGGAAVLPAASLLRSHPLYTPDHCKFETWCESVIAGESGGNATTWRRYGTLHHLSVVIDQVANVHAP